MSKRLVRFLLVLLIVGLISLIFLLNPQETTVFFGRGEQYRGPMALVLIVTFLCGSIFTAALAFIVQFRLSLINWRERQLNKLQREHLKELVNVRELCALQNWDAAKSALGKILREDPENPVARMLLATALEATEGRIPALRVIEEGRGKELSSAELYLKAAELQEKEGNLTAALDNYNLLLQKDPNSRVVLREAVRVAQALGDLYRALNYQERLVRVVERSRYNEEQLRLAAIELEVLKRLPESEQDGALDQLLRRHRDFAPALDFRGNRALERGDLDRATKDLVLAYTSSGEVGYLDTIACAWISRGEPERAIRVVRGAIKERSSPAARVFLAALLGSLGMIEQCERELEECSETDSEIAILTRARLLQSKGCSAEAVILLCSSLDSHYKSLSSLTSDQPLSSRQAASKEQLSPLYSTP